jgi:hypothetical protein
MSVLRWLDSFPMINSVRKTLFKSKLVGAVTASVIGYAIYRGWKYAVQDRDRKELIAGGYLLMEPPNNGMVLSRFNRFYKIAKELPKNGERVDAYPSVEQIEAA